MRYHISTIFFLLLTGINILIFIYRDHFHFQPYQTYDELYQVCDKDCTEKWTQDNSEVKKEAEVKKAHEISHFFLPDTATEFQKAVLITDHIYQEFGHRSGQPSDSFMRLPVMEQYLVSIKNDKESLWCGIYTGMVSLFASSQNITTRIIEIQVAGQSHMLNEYYLPGNDQWFLSDPTFGLLALTNENGGLLNLQSFRIHLKQKKKIFVLTRAGNQFQYIPLSADKLFLNQYYKSLQTKDIYYYHTSLQKAYSPVEKVKRYLLPVSWYEIYSREKKGNLLFFTRLLFLVLWLVSIPIFIKGLRHSTVRTTR